jgi:preprotein translocase subunit SecA
VSYSGGAGSPQPSALASAAAGAGLAQGGAMTPDGLTAEEAPTGAAVVEQRRVDEHDTMGRNEACWCGSGKKFKKCHGS